MKFLKNKSNLTSKQAGDAAETEALQFLQTAGLKLVERNYRTTGRGGGEIDLIMLAQDATLVFIEVRQRQTKNYGGAAASIGRSKQKRIIFAARHFLMSLPTIPPCRFDVVLVEPKITWLQAAFEV